MGINYSRESGSKFPDSLLNMPDFKDVDDSIKEVIKQYYLFMQQGNIDSALALKNANAADLDSYWINAAKLNLLKEEIENIGIYSKRMYGTLFSDTEPDVEQAFGSYWIKPIED